MLVESHPPQKLASLLSPSLPHSGLGSDGLLSSASSLLRYSVNTWDPGFLSKLYASPDAPGVAAELLLATLNTNAHVYGVSPALTVIEKHTATALANLFGFAGPNSGGMSQPGGAASNTTAMLIARNALFPQAKRDGVAALPAKLAVFASKDAHYSVSNAAAGLGLGASCVRSIDTDDAGRMSVAKLREAVQAAAEKGERPFFVAATAGTTVLGAYDPLEGIADVCADFEMWMHVDACWGGGVVFSEKLRKGKLDGCGRADSVSYNPHKMLGVPVTCSFLLGKDMRRFRAAMKLEAGYLFHEEDEQGDDDDDAEHAAAKRPDLTKIEAAERLDKEPGWDQVFDMATFTPQCGRKPDSLKLYLAWQYHGSEGFAAQVERAFAAAEELAEALAKEEAVHVISDRPPPCCQVCFQYLGKDGDGSDAKRNTKITRAMAALLANRGWMIDYASGQNGEFLRAVCNRGTGKEIVDGLIKAVLEAGKVAVERLQT